MSEEIESMESDDSLEAQAACDNCGSVSDSLDSVRVDGSRSPSYLCPDCVDNISACSFCGNASFIDSGDLCASCDNDTTVCYRCDERILTDDSNWSEFTQENYCGECYSLTHSCCDNCSEEYLTRNGPDCNCEDDSEDSYSLADYTFSGLTENPSEWDYHRLPAESKDASPVYLGIELEVELEDNSLSNALRIVRKYLNGFAIVKGDGSLNNGFEIVCTPMTLAYIKKNINFKGLLKELSAIGCTSHNGGTCGLHVHTPVLYGISRYGQKRYDLSRKRYHLQKLVQKDLAALLMVLSRRKSFGYCEFGIEPGSRGDRYRALNVTNSETNEFRLWRGTLKHSSLMAALELTDALVRWSRLIGVSHATTQGEFIDYLKRLNRYHYALPYIDYKLPKNKQARESVDSREVDDSQESIGSVEPSNGLENFRRRALRELFSQPIYQQDTTNIPGIPCDCNYCQDRIRRLNRGE